MFGFDLDELDQQDKDECGEGKPFLVCWYSGGFFKEEGRKLLDGLLGALAKVGIEDHLVLDHTNEYGIVGEGYAPWEDYVDRMVEEIEKKASGRPLILFGHSRGVLSTMSLATRLGKRVKKAYVTGSSAWRLGKPTPWERLSEGFKEKNDQDLIAWFSSLQPGNLLLANAAKAPHSEFEEMLVTSKFLSNMVTLMRLQYRDASFPDCENKKIDVIPADITAIALAKDPGSDGDMVRGFRRFTSGNFSMLEAPCGHMDCLWSPDFYDVICADMKQYVE